MLGSSEKISPLLVLYYTEFLTFSAELTEFPFAVEFWKYETPLQSVLESTWNGVNSPPFTFSMLLVLFVMEGDKFRSSLVILTGISTPP